MQSEGLNQAGQLFFCFVFFKLAFLCASFSLSTNCFSALLLGFVLSELGHYSSYRDIFLHLHESTAITSA